MTGADDGHRAFVCLGSNEAPETHLHQAVEALRAVGTIVRCSRVYESAAAPPATGPSYLNAAVLMSTTHSPHALKAALRELEISLGRNRTTSVVAIDLDLCLYDSVVLADDEIVLPHPLLERPYMAIPVAECDPTFRHPVTGETLSDLAERVRRDDPDALAPRPHVRLC